MRLQRISFKGIITILVSLPLIYNSLVFAEGWSIESLQKEIDARGYKWRDGKTSLSEGLTALPFFLVYLDIVWYRFNP